MTSLILLAAAEGAVETGGTIAIVGYVIVFIALVILVISFIILPKLVQMAVKKQMNPPAKTSHTKEAQMDANINVAIGLGMHMYLNELHDKESNIITIRNAQKQYSPWSSKIYGIMNQPQKR